jgi:hypothetical protein
MKVKQAYRVVRPRDGKLFSAIASLDPMLNSVAGRLYSGAHPIRFQPS